MAIPEFPFFTGSFHPHPLDFKHLSLFVRCTVNDFLPVLGTGTNIVFIWANVESFHFSICSLPCLSRVGIHTLAAKSHCSCSQPSGTDRSWTVAS